jgi:hypothetical protein
MALGIDAAAFQGRPVLKTAANAAGCLKKHDLQPILVNGVLFIIQRLAPKA